MIDKVPAKCPYCGCRSISVEKGDEGYCTCDRCREHFIDKTLPLKLIISELETKLSEIQKVVDVVCEAYCKSTGEIDHYRRCNLINNSNGDCDCGAWELKGQLEALVDLQKKQKEIIK